MKQRNHNFFFLVMLLSFWATAQTEVKGIVKDAATSETLVGATITYASGKGTVTDIDGAYKLNLEGGDYTFTVSYIGYTPITKKIKVKGASMDLHFALEVLGKLDEVEIVADVAKNRETPVAFANIDQAKIQQELGGRDLPMLLNSTPGVYATETGGGAGDARINVRGFDQRNVAVMVDGVPFNDMETGAVYWSNWNGIGSITRSMQIQRGLGASKLAVASVGGTINILTKGIDSKPGGMIKQMIGNNNQTQTAIGYNSGMNKNGVGVTFSLMYGQGDGWVDQTWNKSFSYFFKIQKRYKSHLFTFGVNGAKQEHAQRPSVGSSGRQMYYYDEKFSKEQGINTDTIYGGTDKITPKGIRNNYSWGYYFDSNGTKHIVNNNTNYYHKPVFSASDFWTITDKMYVSNTAYLSVGHGGGATMQSVPTANWDNEYGQTNYQAQYDANISFLSKTYSTTEHIASSYARSSVNNHFWYGLLSVLNYKLTKKTSMQVGLDGRSYNGYHWQTPADLMGGDYMIDASNKTQPSGVGNEHFQMKRVGDKIGYNYTGVVRRAGIFTQVEHKHEKFSVFFNGTSNLNFYKRIDYFARKDLFLSDTTIRLALAYQDTIRRNGNTYTINSPEAKTASTIWKKYLTFTVKTGLNYNINSHQNAFMNIGYLVLPPQYVNVFDRNNRLFSDVKNQYVKAIEMGYGIKYTKFAVNVNAYYTIWENKPPDFSSSKPDKDGNPQFYNINGMNALHKGIEFDFNYKPFSKLSLDGVISLGDWTYTSQSQYTILDINGLPIIDAATKLPAAGEFDAKGVHVGNAAQRQYVLGAKYNYTKHAFIRARFTYFDKNYAGFDPTTLYGANARRESWKMPAYGLVDTYAGYDLSLSEKKKLSFNLGVINVLNTKFISDAQNNGALVNGGFNAYSAYTYFGQGRRWTLTAQLTF